MWLNLVPVISSIVSSGFRIEQNKAFFATKHIWGAVLCTDWIMLLWWQPIITPTIFQYQQDLPRCLILLVNPAERRHTGSHPTAHTRVSNGEINGSEKGNRLQKSVILASLVQLLTNTVPLPARRPRCMSQVMLLCHQWLWRLEEKWLLR